MASAEEDVGFDEIAEEIFEALKVIQVYIESPRVRVEDYAPTDPLVLPIGATQLHKGLTQGLRYAVLWGDSGKFDCQHVGVPDSLRKNKIC